ncbi:pirin family protein [Antrihabitans cavernicola]|uniref:Pirin family protein n=1 Tax=Antrihabitans cavernicola TaxID=2495913 RepID=A0A5A7S4X9_9NOCA|nr:pirin family protein [Spelaeibacter cavernicola]KAA0016522.1 pirin family protein [Spelaeibacter cavernicola]
MKLHVNNVTVIPSADRAHWWNEWLDSKQSFPATGNFDLAGNAHGLLLVHNEDVVDSGAGFDTHQHRDMEIVTWVLEGSVVHQDSVGNSGVIYPDLVQRMSAGSGIMHSEKNGSGWRDRKPLHVIQMWVPPDENGVAPSYQESDVGTRLAANGLTTVASGMAKHREDTSVTIGNRNAAMHVARLGAGQSVTIPEAPYLHVFVAKGAAEFEGHGNLAQGDAARITAGGGYRVTAKDDAEIVVWEMHASAR